MKQLPCHRKYCVKEIAQHYKSCNLKIDKLQNNTNLGAEGISIDEKAKYAKAINDFVNAKKKTIDSKFEIAKFMGELVKHSGDLNGALNDPAFSKTTKSDFSDKI